MTTRRHVAAAAVGASVLLAGVPAGAQARTTVPHRDRAFHELERTYLKAYRRADRAGAQPGRNIVRDGVRAHGHRRAATEREVRRSLKVLRRMVAPAAPAVASGVTGSAAGAGLQAIAACESGGDPAAVDASGTYRGKYQFDQQTWEAVGGTGDPAAASEAEQDARARTLLAQRGTAAWPVCGG